LVHFGLTLNNKRLEIILAKCGRESQERKEFSSKYLKWYSSERKNLFHLFPIYLSDVNFQDLTFFDSSLVKIGTTLEASILTKLRNLKDLVGSLTCSVGEYSVFYTRKVSFFLQFLNFIPEVRGENGGLREPSELKRLNFDDDFKRYLSLAALSSSLFYWFNIVHSDCRNLNKRETISFPVPNPNDFLAKERNALIGIVNSLMEDYGKNSSMRTVNYKNRGKVSVQYFNFRPSKPIIDQIDRLFGKYYGFTDEELDFIINYDIKYRMGADERAD
jgi:hypothetical protein